MSHGGPNHAEIELWNGEVGTRWVANQPELDRRFRPFGEAVLAAAKLADGMRVLDVGCGCGDTTVAAAARVAPGGRVLGVDVSAPMLARARERTAGLESIRLVQADASTFTPAADGPFHVAISRFGVMFFQHPVAAFTNLRRSIGAGGHFVFVCWKTMADNPWAGVPLAIVAELFDTPPAVTPEGPGPFSLSSAERVREILGASGFDEVTVEEFVHPVPFGASLDEAVAYASSMGPAARLLRAAGDPELVVRAERALRAGLGPLAPRFELDGAAWLVRARASSV